MDGGSGQPVVWRSSIPGVSQRDGAPASLGLPRRGVHASATGQAAGPGDRVGSPIVPAGDGRPGSRRRRRVVQWRAIALAVVALGAIVGVGHAAGLDAGVGPGTLDSAWEPLGAGDGATLGAGDGSAAKPDPMGPSSPGSPTQEAAAPLAEPGDESPDWWTVLAQLDARRVRTLTEVDPALLSTYAQMGSTAWEEDAALLADLSGRGLRPQGLGSRVLAVERIDHDGPVARLQVVDQRTGYSMVNSLGEVVQQVALAGPRRWAVTLSRLAPAGTGPAPGGAAGLPEANAEPSQSGEPDPGWRVASAAPVPSGGSTGVEADDRATPRAEDPAVGGVP